MQKTNVIKKTKNNIKKYKIKNISELKNGYKKDHDAIKSDWETVVGIF
jgi:hypothetical protein